ncbi:hypothetical protein [Haloarchaeobius litoreus]|uniref:TraB family protein n=1 Tax=Haloarchaeobius litoreus TaxID=755306 RepID=A0ABD6DNW9_9EURY|nr:hypothetical protein [Haloarchaeobius litoreus]
MFASDPTPSLPSSETDPRFHDRWFRYIPASDGDGWVLLVGVVHDHPSSLHRAAETVRRLEPSVLALELPQLGIPLFERHADRADSPPRYGGEMAAALAERGESRVVGIDAPNRHFVRELTAYVRSERPPWERVAGVLAGATPILRHALRYRIAAMLDARTHLRLVPDVPTEFDVSVDDPPAEQAADEYRQLSRSRSLLSAVELPPDVAELDRLREATMAARLRSLRSEGSVVAILGQDHLDAVEKRVHES